MTKTRRFGISWLLFGLSVCIVSCRPAQTPSPQTPLNPPAAQESVLLVSAASSLTDAFNEIGTAFTKENFNVEVRFNFAASGALQQQIEQGAPVDVFASASTKEIEVLEKGNLLEPETRIEFAGNRLVLIARPETQITGWSDLTSSSVKRIALSNPDSVPSGRYAKETLTQRKLWEKVLPKVVFGENVRQTLTYVTNGDVDAGVVFATDAQQEKAKVIVAAMAVSGKDHAPILYPAVVIAKSSQKESAKRFVLFLQSPAAQTILAKYGFAAVRKR